MHLTVKSGAHFEKLTKDLKNVWGDIKEKMKCSVLNINMYCIKNPAKSVILRQGWNNRKALLRCQIYFGGDNYSIFYFCRTI